MKGKPNRHQERRGKQAFKRHISEREADYPSFQKEFRHIEGETIVGARHKSVVITLVERLTKVIIALKPAERKACDIEAAVQPARCLDLFCGPRRALNKNSNGLLRKDGLAKKMDFNQVDQQFISTVADKWNNIPRKSLDYRTPLEAFLSHLNGMDLSSLY